MIYLKGFEAKSHIRVNQEKMLQSESYRNMESMIPIVLAQELFLIN